MNFTLPIYVETRRAAGRTLYRCEPLFSPGLNGSDASLAKAMSKLLRKLKPHLNSLARSPRHHELARYTFCPDFDTHVLKLTLDLRDSLARCRLLVAVLPAMERRVAFSPSVPELWFELTPGESLTRRATEVFSDYFRKQIRLTRHSGSEPPLPNLSGQAWVAMVDVDVAVAQTGQSDVQDVFAALWETGAMDGATELQRVGRCLDWLYPDELQRAVLRDKEVDALLRLTCGEDRRPVLLVGPRLAGKTTVIHEFVYRRVARRKRSHAARSNVWLLSPQRLISGMSYVGQWESRVLEISKEARRRDHVLYFDDLLGLYQAGISANSRLSVADVLRSAIVHRELRVLGELTPEGLAALEERDRGLADQFQIVPITATSEDATQRILLQVRRQLEGNHGCRFAMEAVPTVLELTRRYEREAAFPGKAARLLQHLGVKHPQADIDREAVYRQYHAETGLSLALLDKRQRLTRERVLELLRSQIIGQDEAVEAAADVVTVAKAGMNDPSRPLATLLFLGPTGVGKTQCAKALANVLFSEPSRLLRFDMNEFVSPDSAARLVGTFADPEGLLTSAVRRQPCAVVLLDEIEKAHPDVFDLLLQVTGEGRLTDAVGRTSDFSNTVIVMTSNLGVRQTARQIGWKAPADGQRHAFVKAAEDFFRPEFFNRIDRVIPFTTLDREDMAKIADLLLRDLLRREGLVRRGCALHVDRRAMEWITDEGYHPQLGARALKRAIEKQLTQGIAAHLTSTLPAAPTQISVYREPHGIVADVQSLEYAPPICDPWTADPAAVVERSEHLCRVLRGQLDALRPANEVTSRDVPPDALQYYALKEQLSVVSEGVCKLKELTGVLEQGPVRPDLGRSVRDHSQRTLKMQRRLKATRRLHHEIQAAAEIDEFVGDWEAVASTAAEELPRVSSELQRQAAWLWTMWQSRGKPEQLVMLIRAITRAGTAWAARLRDEYVHLFQGELSFDCRLLPPVADQELDVLALAGSFIWPLAVREQGIHMFRADTGDLVPVQVLVWPAAQGDGQAALHEWVERRRQWLDQLACGRASRGDDPWPLGPVVRTYQIGGETTDMRTGRICERWPSPADWKAMLFGGQEPPPAKEPAG